MRTTRNLVSRCAAAAVLTLSLAAVPSAHSGPAAQPDSLHALAGIRIDNFGRINDSYYRGAQPDASDYADLAGLGVKTVVDLTRDGRSDEAGLVARAGMQFYRIPLTTSDRPAQAAISQFLQIVTDPANQPVYVHCQGGRHRTGVMTALYRMTEDGWTADRAYAEMKQFNFEGIPGHPTLKRFVYDYYSRFAPATVASRKPPAEATAASR